MSVQLEAALASQALGFEEKPSDFAVIKVDDAVVAIPNGSTLLSVEEEDGHLSVEWVPDLTDPSPGTFADATALNVEDSAGMLHRDGSCGYYTSNNTGWMRTCFYRYRSSKTIKWEDKNQYLNIIAVEATHESKSHWIMEKACIRVNPRVSDISH